MCVSAASQGAGTGHLAYRLSVRGLEDFRSLSAAPPGADVAYDITLGKQIAGLRLVGGSLELLDATPPGAGVCTVHVTWDNQGVAFVDTSNHAHCLAGRHDDGLLLRRHHGFRRLGGLHQG